MKSFISLILCFFITNSLFAQSKYGKMISKADSLYDAKDYKNSAFTYSSAFRLNNQKASPVERYNAACSWARANYPDSAFSNLQKSGYTEYDHVLVDSDLMALHNDARWKPMLAIVQANLTKSEAKYNWPLVHELDSIFNNDQRPRRKIDTVEKEYGRDSKQMHALWKDISYKDSVDLIKVIIILDKYGWLSPDIISRRGNTTLFLVVQHADIKIRDKYLPLMRAAVAKGEANGSQLALMEDRSALEHGKKQIYGSQVARDEKTGKYYLSPIEDEVNVDKRRASVGLPPLAGYVRQWGIVYKAPQQ
jgi:hypothetical protein